MRMQRFLVTALVLSWVQPAAVRAEVTPVGPEFQVNTYTTGNQGYPTVAATADGSFVVVWQSSNSYSFVGQDGSGSGVFGQRHDGSGARLGTEFQVNTYTTGDQALPDVTTDAAGNFVVAWQSGSYYGRGQDGSALGAFVQRYASSGTRLGSELQANTYTRGSQSSPAVASDAAGNFLVVWQSGSYFGVGGQDGSRSGVFGQRYDASGMQVGTEFQVNTYTTGDQVGPAVAADPSGNFVVVWQSGTYYGGPGQDGSGGGVFGQRFSPSGVPLGGEFQVNTYTTGSQGAPAVGTDPAGNFVVVWQSGSYGPSQDGSGAGVFGQRFSSSGMPLGSEFQVNTYTTGSQVVPKVATSPAGDFMVVWESQGYPGQDGSGAGVFGQHFASSGEPLGAEFQVNTYTTGSQGRPAVAADATGFVVTWQSGGYPGSQDGSGNGVFARRFRTTARAFPTAVSGARLLLRDDPADPTRKAISVRSLDDISPGGGNGSDDDPTLSGGNLRVRSARFDDTYVLPAANWHYLGAPGQNKGYEYRDEQLLAGPIALLRVRNGSFIKIAGKGAQLGHDLAVNPDPVIVILQRGGVGQRDCMAFGGTTQFKPMKSFRGVRAPGACPR
jgi:hypothetical protein